MFHRLTSLVALASIMWLAGCNSEETIVTAAPTATVILEPVPLGTTEADKTLPLKVDQGGEVATAIPLPSPTPLVYVVEAGDTFSGIAYRFGLSTAALSAANPGIDTQVIYIGQQINIPAADADLSGFALLPSPTPRVLPVSGVAFYESSSGGFWCLGEIDNPTEYSLENVHMAMTVYSSSGDTMENQDAWVAGQVIPPGESRPFAIHFGNAPSFPASYKIDFISSEPVYRYGPWHLNLQVENVEGNNSGAMFRISGIVHNTGETAAIEPVVLITLYDRDGNVTGYGQQVIAEYIEVGANIAFDVRLTPAGSGTATQNVYAVGTKSW